MGAVDTAPMFCGQCGSSCLLRFDLRWSSECSKAGSLWIEILRAFSASGISRVYESFAICALFSPKMAHRELKTTSAYFGLC